MEYKWPEEMQQHAEGLEAAAAKAGPQMAEWPEGEGFLEAEQAAYLAKELIRLFHPELRNVTIRCLFKEELGNQRHTVWGKAAKAPAQWSFLSEIDFVLTFNWTIWKDLSIAQRAALVDHELEHCFVEETETGHKLVTVPHDLEEFNTIVRRWGLWRSSIANFVEAAKPQLQLALE